MHVFFYCPFYFITNKYNKYLSLFYFFYQILWISSFYPISSYSNFKHGDKNDQVKVRWNIEETKVARTGAWKKEHRREGRGKGRGKGRGERKNYRLSYSRLELQREFIESIGIYKDNASNTALLILNIFVVFLHSISLA